MSLFLQPVLQDLLPFLSYVRVNWIQLITNGNNHCRPVFSLCCIRRASMLLPGWKAYQNVLSVQIWLNWTMKTFPFITWTSKGKEHVTWVSQLWITASICLCFNGKQILKYHKSHTANHWTSQSRDTTASTFTYSIFIWHFFKVCISCARWMLFSLILLFILMN